MLARAVGGGLQNPLSADLNFNHFKAVAMAVDQGATLPSSPITGQWFLHTPTGRKVLMMYNGTAWTPIISLGAITIYVDTTGTDDTAHGTGGGTSAFKTWTYALSQVPGLIGGNVTINGGVGNFNESITIFGKNFTGAYTISLVGSTTTLSSGTATSSTATTLTDTTKAWTANAYVEKFVYIIGGTGAGQLRLIKSNTATQLTVYQWWDNGTPLDATSTYQILDLTTTGLSLTGDNGQQGIVGTYLNLNKSSYYNCLAQNSAAITLNGCLLSGATGWTIATQFMGNVTLHACVAYSGPGLLINGFGCLILSYGSVIRNMTGWGVYVLVGWLYLYEGNEVRNNTSHGVYCQANSVFQNIPTNTAGRQNSFTSNGGWGVYCDSGSQGTGLSYGYFSGNTSGTYSANAAQFAYVA